ncbi:hypothetical protein [Flavobacterium sp.]|uniref:hypothetical protein n=1 Tax=Flavobacterium sp. TaxID=239 RepID=UPI00374FFE21
MKTTIPLLFLSLLSLLLFECHSNTVKKADDYGKVMISPKDLNHYANETIKFTCKNSIEDFDLRYSKIEIKNDTLQIFNSYNDGYEGAKITFHILKDLTIKEIAYEDWDDVEDGTTDTIEVMEAQFNMNSNPFTKGLNGLKGNYYLKIKKVNSNLERSIEERTTFLTLNGVISCS